MWHKKKKGRRGEKKKDKLGFQDYLNISIYDSLGPRISCDLPTISIHCSSTKIFLFFQPERDSLLSKVIAPDPVEQISRASFAKTTMNSEATPTQAHLPTEPGARDGNTLGSQSLRASPLTRERLSKPRGSLSHRRRPGWLLRARGGLKPRKGR